MKLQKYLTFVLIPFFFIACENEEKDAISARKNNTASALSKSLTYTGEIETALDTYSICETGTKISLSMLPGNNSVFALSFFENDFLEEANSLFKFSSIAYATPADFTGVFNVKDEDNVFEDMAVKCSVFEGYAQKVELSLSGAISDDKQDLFAIYTLSVQCNKGGKKFNICQGTLSAETQTE